MKRLSWKYMAGLIDGEGCIDARFYRNKGRMNKSAIITPRARITLSDCGSSVLSMIHANHGGWLNYRKSGNDNWQDSITWTLQGPKLRPFLQNLVNHLYIKKEQAKLAIWIYDTLCQRSTRFPARVKQIASNMMKAMKTDPQRLSEAAIREIKQSKAWKDFDREVQTQCLDCEIPFEKKQHEARGYCKACYQRHKRWGKFQD